MTQDPERLLALREGDSIEREVLIELRAAKAPADARTAAWQGVAAGVAAAALPPAGVAASVASAPAAKAAVGASTKATLMIVAKVSVFAVLGGAALGGSAYLANRQGSWTPQQHAITPRAPRPSRASLRASATPPASTEAAIVDPPAVTAPATSAPVTLRGAKSAAAMHSPAKPATAELLAEESALLATARAQLRDGDFRAAEASLRELRLGFAHGALVQEREVLEIEVFAARGERDAAKLAAQAFVARHPHSPHSAKLRARLADP